MKDKLQIFLICVGVILLIIVSGKSLIFFYDKPETTKNGIIFIKTNWHFILAGLTTLGAGVLMD